MIFDIYFLVSLLFLAIVSIIQIISLKSELQSTFKNTDWSIQNDEKLIITDARNLYLRKMVGSKLTDTKPWPVCSAFGISAPILSYIGFLIFGFNNVGFRFFYCCAGIFSNIFIVLFVHIIFPGFAGMAFSLFLVTSYNLFYLNHCAIVENFLTLYMLTLILIIVFAGPDFFTKYGFFISFFMASSILFKINFPVYLAVFIGLANIFYFVNFEYFLKSAGGFALGLLLFEGIQYMVLFTLGILKEKFRNLYETLKAHSGDNSFVSYDFRPVPLAAPYKTIQYFFHLFWDLKLSKEFAINISLMLICFLGLYLSELSRFSVFLLTFIAVCFFFTSLMFLYYKRTLFLLFASYCAIISIANDLILTEHGAQMLGLVVIGMLFARLCFFWKEKHYLKRNRLTMENSMLLEAIVPAGSIIGAYSVPFRFLWQVRRRILCWEDGLYTNEEMINAAKQKGAGYMMLLDDLEPFLKEKYSLSDVCTFNTDDVSSDKPYKIQLYRFDEEIGAGHI